MNVLMVYLSAIRHALILMVATTVVVSMGTA